MGVTSDAPTIGANVQPAGPSGEEATAATETSESPSDDPSVRSPSTPERSAFTYDKDKHRVLLDTQATPPQKRTFWLVLGSVTIETLNATNGVLKLRYTLELEGGYSVSECETDISATPIIFQFGSDGTPGKAPDELRNCRPVRWGNVHTDLSNPRNDGGE